MLEISFQVEPRLLIAQYSGTGMPQDVVQHFPAILEQCLLKKRLRLLVDFSTVVHPAITTFDLYHIGSSANLFTGKVEKVASLVRPDQKDRDELGIRVARNRGLEVREFTSLDSARKWLQA